MRAGWSLPVLLCFDWEVLPEVVDLREVADLRPVAGLFFWLAMLLTD